MTLTIQIPTPSATSSLDNHNVSAAMTTSQTMNLNVDKLQGDSSFETTPKEPPDMLQSTSSVSVPMESVVVQASDDVFVIERINAFAPTPERKFVLGLPTGSSPGIVYRCLVEACKAGRISFRNVVTFNMVVLLYERCFA